MLFLEVDDVERHWSELKTLELPARYENVRLTSIRTEPWGKEYFLHDPSGVLWHFGEFRNKAISNPHQKESAGLTVF